LIYYAMFEIKSLTIQKLNFKLDRLSKK